MSEITERIQRYHDTQLGWVELRDWLATRRYPMPERYAQPRDPLAEDDDEWPYTEGTWDEVNDCAARGLLTEAEYLEVSRLADEDAARTSPPKAG